jgi:hypothetical protein
VREVLLTCHLCGRTTDKKTLTDHDRDGWDWFTGYFAQRVEICSACSRSRQQDVERLKARSSVRPDGWPHTTVQPPALPR